MSSADRETAIGAFDHSHRGFGWGETSEECFTIVRIISYDLVMHVKNTIDAPWNLENTRALCHFERIN